MDSHNKSNVLLQSLSQEEGIKEGSALKQMFV